MQNLQNSIFESNSLKVLKATLKCTLETQSPVFYQKI